MVRRLAANPTDPTQLESLMRAAHYLDAVRLLAELPEQELGEYAANAVGLLALVAAQDAGRGFRWS